MMLRPDEIDQTTDALEALPSELEPFARSTEFVPSSRTMHRRNALVGQRQGSQQHHIFEDKQTDTLPALEFEPPKGRGALRQAAVLREENRRLRSLLEQQQAELQQLHAERNSLRDESEKALEISEHGLQQEIAHFQQQSQEALVERDHLREKYELLEERYQELQASIEEEARRQVEAATQALLASPGQVPVLFQDVAKTLELRLRQEEERHLVETLYLKREMQRMTEFLEHEHKQLQAESQQLAALQFSVHAQAKTRQKLLHDRLRNRWKTAAVATSLGLLALLVVLQFVCLSLLHIPLIPTTSFALVAPVVVCVVLAFVLAIPLSTIRQMYQAAPHRAKGEIAED